MQSHLLHGQACRYPMLMLHVHPALTTSKLSCFLTNPGTCYQAWHFFKYNDLRRQDAVRIMKTLAYQLGTCPELPELQTGMNRERCVPCFKQHKCGDPFQNSGHRVAQLRGVCCQGCCAMRINWEFEVLQSNVKGDSILAADSITRQRQGAWNSKHRNCH